MVKIIEADLFEYKEGVSRYVKQIEDDCKAKLELAENKAREAYKLYEESRFDMARIQAVNYRQKMLINKINLINYKGNIDKELQELRDATFYLESKKRMLPD